MRTLFVSDLVPHPLNTGRSQRVGHLLKAVSEVSEVTFVCATPGGQRSAGVDAIRPLCREVVLFRRESFAHHRDAASPFPLGSIRRWLRYCHPTRPALVQWFESRDGRDVLSRLCERPFDVVWAERLSSLAVLPSRPSGRLIIDLDDLEYRKALAWLGRRPFRIAAPVEWLEVLRLRRWEQSLTKRGWEVVVCSEVDRAALGGGRAIWIVPNGVDLPKAGEAGGSRQQDPILLFVGYMSYAPNVDAVTFFAHRVLPLIRREMPQAVFVIAGRDPSPTVRALHDGATIVVTGTVPDMEPYWRRAAISVAPIRVAGGTRIKILEAMAHRVPVVSTALGAEGLEALAGQHLLVADSPRDLAATCLRLLRDPSLGEPLTERGFDLVRTHYQWDQTRELVRQIVESSGARRDLARA